MDERLKDELRSLFENDERANHLIDAFSEIDAIYLAAKAAMGSEIPPKIESRNAANVKLAFNASDFLAHL